MENGQLRRIRREGRPPIDMVAIAERVYRQRTSIGMSQDELATIARVSRAYVSRLENAGIPDPHMQDMAAIAEALGFRSLDDLVYGPLSDERQEALERLLRHRELAEAFSQVAHVYEDTRPADRGFVLEVLRLASRRRGLSDDPDPETIAPTTPSHHTDTPPR